jgi:hypothetical protein
MSYESWKKSLASTKDQLRVIKMHRSDALKNLSDIIAAQTNSKVKADYRQRKAEKKKEWDSKIEYQKQYVDNLRNSKPAR